MKYILIPCLLLAACANPKEEIVEQIKQEKKSLASLKIKNYEFVSRIRGSFNDLSVPVDQITSSPAYTAMRDSGRVVEMDIILSESKIDSLELELKKY